MIDPRDTMGELSAAGNFLWGLGSFLGRPVDRVGAARRLEKQLANRQKTFAEVLRRAVFEHPTSPYRKLFEWADITLADVTEVLAKVGVEAALEKLHEAGVYLTLEEFKGFRPITRPGLEIPVVATDFDNPLSAKQYEARTGGSGDTPRRILVGLDLLEHETAYHALFFAAFDAAESPMGMWLPAPPGAVGIKNALMGAKLGRPPEQWFAQNRIRDAPFKHTAFGRAMILTARFHGIRIPSPQFTPAKDVGRVVAWLAEKSRAGTPAVLITTPSSAVRACAEAIESGVSIAKTLFVLVGEPYTSAKAAMVAQAGATAVCHYAMVEAGLIGLACQAPNAVDDVHLVSDKIATIQRPLVISPNGDTVDALLHTSLLSAAPKLMLNVESGDYGVLEERDCGCHVLPSGFRKHLHTIRSYEKLTSEGMHFLGADLLSLVEQVLPAAFGGRSTDYQFIEREEAGLPKVSLIVSPSVGDLDRAKVVRVMLEYLGTRGIGQRLMADIWDQSRTLEVVRREPHVTPGGKIQPLQKLGD